MRRTDKQMKLYFDNTNISLEKRKEDGKKSKKLPNVAYVLNFSHLQL